MRVAVTTRADRFDRVAGAFSQFGLSPVPLPCLRIEPAAGEVLAEARRSVMPGVALLLSSARPLGLLWPVGDLPPVSVIGVGAATAAAVRKRGGTVEFWGSDGLSAVAEQADLDGRHIVFPHAAGTDPAVVTRISGRAVSLAAPVVYETVSQPPGEATVDAVAFGSPSAVHGWVSARSLESLLVGAIGATTAGALEARGCSPDVIGPRPGFVALAEAMARRLGVVS